MNLDKLKEEVIVGYIHKLISREFSPRLAAVANIANSLRAKRNID
jgi:hypothetical protein